MENKQTAVEFLIDKIKYNDFVKAFDAVEWLEIRTQAKQIEQEQMAKQYKKGWDESAEYLYKKFKEIINGIHY